MCTHPKKKQPPKQYRRTYVWDYIAAVLAQECADRNSYSQLSDFFDLAEAQIKCSNCCGGTFGSL